MAKARAANNFIHIPVRIDLGVRKPDPEILIYALRSMWIKGSEAVHVGTSLENDIHGSTNAGMKRVWVKGDEEVMNIHPDFVISKVTEMPSLF